MTSTTHFGSAEIPLWWIAHNGTTVFGVGFLERNQFGDSGATLETFTRKEDLVSRLTELGAPEFISSLENPYA